jgi:hypothetical protein
MLLIILGNTVNITDNSKIFAGSARLPGFHTCVGANDELLTTKWYKEQGRFLLQKHYN